MGEKLSLFLQKGEKIPGRFYFSMEMECRPMPDLLGVTNPVPGHDSSNVNRSIPVSPNDTRIQNAPDLNRVSRPDNRTERQDAGDSTGAGRMLRYDSNFRTFLQRLGNSPDSMRSLRELCSLYGGTVVASGMGEGIATEMATFLGMLKMDQSQLMKFFFTQMASGNRFQGALFNLLRQAYSTSDSQSLQNSILQFLKRYGDYSSSRHIEGSLLRLLTRLTRSIPASYGNQLLPMVAQLQSSMQQGDRAGSLKLLQGTILPFLGSYTKQTNDMGLSRTLISMLSLDISRYENGSQEGLLQAFHQLNGHAVLRERLGLFNDETLLRLVEENSYMKAAQNNDFARQLSEAAQRALEGGGGTDTQEAFRNLLSAILINESVYMPLNHMLIPLEWEGKMMFSELWVDPDAEDNLRRGQGQKENTIRFLFKMDIQGLGFFDMVLSCQKDKIGVQVNCPEAVVPFSSIVEGELSRIFQENGFDVQQVRVQKMEKPLTISSVFPRIFEGENSVNVTI